MNGHQAATAVGRLMRCSLTVSDVRIRRSRPESALMLRVADADALWGGVCAIWGGGGLAK